MTDSRTRQPGRPTSTSASQALAPREQKAQAIAKLIAAPASSELEVVQRFNQLAASGLVNLVTPVTAISKIPEWTTVSFARVEINGTEEEGDVYVDRRFCKGNEVALTKNAILRLMQAAGIQKLRSYQADQEGDPNFVQWTVFLQWRDFSGRWLPKEISKTIDLRDGAPATMKPEWKDNRKTGNNVPLEDSALAQARLHIHAQAETKALLRGVREFLALKQKYRKAELERPFVVPTLVPDLPMDDPQVKAAVLARELGLSNDLYGGGQPAGPNEARSAAIGQAIVEHDDRSRGITRELEPPTAAAIAPIEKIDADVTPAPDDDRVVDVQAEAAGPAGPEPPPIEDEMPPALEDEPTRPSGACSCPCGCAEVPSAGLAKKSKATLQTVRCSACYPDLGFDQARHAGLGNLEIPKAPNATPEQVEAWNKRRRANSRGGSR